MSRESTLNRILRLAKERERLAGERERIVGQMDGLSFELKQIEAQLAEIDGQLVGGASDEDHDRVASNAAPATVPTSTPAEATIATSSARATGTADPGGQVEGDDAPELPRRPTLRSPTMSDRIRCVFEVEPKKLFDAHDVREALVRDGFGPVSADSVRVTLMRLSQSNVLERIRNGRYQWAGTVRQAGAAKARAATATSNGKTVDGTVLVGTEEVL